MEQVQQCRVGISPASVNKEHCDNTKNILWQVKKVVRQWYKLETEGSTHFKYFFWENSATTFAVSTVGQRLNRKEVCKIVMPLTSGLWLGMFFDFDILFLTPLAVKWIIVYLKCRCSGILYKNLIRSNVIQVEEVGMIAYCMYSMWNHKWSSESRQSVTVCRDTTLSVWRQMSMAYSAVSCSSNVSMS